METLLRVIELGITNSTTPDEARRLRLTNAITFLVMLNAIPFVFAFGSLEPILGLITLVTIAFLSLPALLNTFGRTTLSRWVLLIVQPCAVTLFAELVGPGVGIENMLLGSSVLAMLVFSPKRPLPIIVGLAVAWTGRFALLLTHNDIFEFVPSATVPADFVGPLSVMLLAATLILLTAVVAVPVVMQDRAHARLAARNEELKLERLARNEADAKSASKTRFLSNMSHELRTPLHTIIGYADLIEDTLTRDDVDPEQVREDLGRIRSAGDHMIEIVSDVLDLASIESGSASFERERVELDALLVDVGNHASALARRNENTFEFETDRLPDAIETNALRLRQILLNVLSNASKFTESGRITLRVTRPDEDTLLFEVEDTGKGIPEDHLDAIFDVFQRVDAHQEGTGLGLAVSRELARALGGDLTARSTLGEGSCFSLTLPIHD